MSLEGVLSLEGLLSLEGILFLQGFSLLAGAMIAPLKPSLKSYRYLRYLANNIAGIENDGSTLFQIRSLFTVLGVCKAQGVKTEREVKDSNGVRSGTRAEVGYLPRTFTTRRRDSGSTSNWRGDQSTETT